MKHKFKYKPRRNDPCPCGSGKKYKTCCGNEAVLTERRLKNCELLESPVKYEVAKTKWRVRKVIKWIKEKLFGAPHNEQAHDEMDKRGKERGFTVAYAPWHKSREYKVIHKGDHQDTDGRALPHGLIIVEKDGKFKMWKP